ncbi:hypothetical protein [Streptomyces sp. NBC_00620]|uniref:hypothetical protein n=1 Tax=Streptomyces sp. NBC_00620 TaxID=2903666 RepID=UPI00225A4C17|nr:hypothetical protein [Streptomyces sp. NBC_00620]MCX4971410.1 hypothetical protein [Streptomyces sp. NBC_00620]
MSNSGLPADVDEIMDLIGSWVEMSGYLKWNEQAKIKADMMNVRHRWSSSRVSSETLRGKCQAIGLVDDETTKVVEWLHAAQEGRQLSPHGSYRDFRFNQEPTP